FVVYGRSDPYRCSTLVTRYLPDSRRPTRCTDTSAPAPSHGLPLASPRSTTAPPEALSINESASASASAGLLAGNCPVERVIRPKACRAAAAISSAAGASVPGSPMLDRPVMADLSSGFHALTTTSSQCSEEAKRTETFVRFSPHVTVNGLLRPSALRLKK